jgi:hypothetical protein
MDNFVSTKSQYGTVYLLMLLAAAMAGLIVEE